MKNSKVVYAIEMSRFDPIRRESNSRCQVAKSTFVLAFFQFRMHWPQNYYFVRLKYLWREEIEKKATKKKGDLLHWGWRLERLFFEVTFDWVFPRKWRAANLWNLLIWTWKIFKTWMKGKWIVSQWKKQSKNTKKYVGDWCGWLGCARSFC